MSDKKISQLTASTTPLAGTEVLPVVQSGDTKQVSVANLTAGRDVAVNILDAASSVQIGSVAQNETHQYMLSNWNTVNEFATRITSDYFGKTKIATTTIPTGSDPSLGSYLDRLVISGDNVEVSRGNLVIGTSGKGIDFSADGSAAGMTSELLDDYEEGTWTPAYNDLDDTLRFASYVRQAGTYTKIGNTVYCWGHIETNGVTAFGTGFLVIEGLPFSSKATNNINFTGSVGFSRDFEGNYDAPHSVMMLQGTAQIMLKAMDATTGEIDVAILGTSAFIKNAVNSNNIQFFISYQVA